MAQRATTEEWRSKRDNPKDPFVVVQDSVSLLCSLGGRQSQCQLLHIARLKGGMLRGIIYSDQSSGVCPQSMSLCARCVFVGWRHIRYTVGF